MDYIYLIGSVFFSASSSLLAAAFNRKNTHPSAVLLYNLLYSVVAWLGWGVLYLTKFSFEPGVLLYSAAFGISYTVAVVFQVLALKHGPTSLTGLMMQMALILTTVFGLFFWNAPITLPVIIGLILVVISIYLSVYQKGADTNKLSPKWFLYAMLAMIGNAGCSIFQRQQQIAFNGKNGEMLMFFALMVTTTVCLVRFLTGKKENIGETIRRSGYIPAISGALNVALNLFVILLATSSLSSSLIYPVIGVGGLAVTALVSAILFREKLSVKQWIGMGIGAVAIGLLSI